MPPSSRSPPRSIVFFERKGQCTARWISALLKVISSLGHDFFLSGIFWCRLRNHVKVCFVHLMKRHSEFWSMQDFAGSASLNFASVAPSDVPVYGLSVGLEAWLHFRKYRTLHTYWNEISAPKRTMTRAACEFISQWLMSSTCSSERCKACYGFSNQFDMLAGSWSLLFCRNYMFVEHACHMGMDGCKLWDTPFLWQPRMLHMEIKYLCCKEMHELYSMRDFSLLLPLSTV
jgi:hypothetical protein